MNDEKIIKNALHDFMQKMISADLKADLMNMRNMKFSVCSARSMLRTRISSDHEAAATYFNKNQKKLTETVLINLMMSYLLSSEINQLSTCKHETQICVKISVRQNSLKFQETDLCKNKKNEKNNDVNNDKNKKNDNESKNDNNNDNMKNIINDEDY